MPSANGGARGAAILFAVLLTALRAFSLEWSGECVKVVDGDTIDVMYHELPIRVRLYGIDAPERGKPYSKRATEHMRHLVLGRIVRVEMRGRDTFNRVIGLVHADGLNVNVAMLEAGMAWVFARYCTDPACSEWHQAEEAAKLAGVGMWQR